MRNGSGILFAVGIALSVAAGAGGGAAASEPESPPILVGLEAVIGGLHTPVALDELALVHQHRLIYLGPWAAGTGIVDNGYTPNYVFRVSVRDQLAGGFLVGRALAAGYRHPGLLLERTAWGRSNEKAITAERHDALTAADFRMARFGRGGRIIPEPR